ncbi:MAG: N-acetyltransferase [Lachnospiraceae bacterium]
MIRRFKTEDLTQVMEIWLSANIKAHDFISRNYWEDNFDMVKGMLPGAELYVFEPDDKIEGFIGIDHGYIAGIFVSNEMQSKGIGKQLLERAKELYPELSLTVYQKNIKAVNFYYREQFQIKQKRIDENTSEIEYVMVWSRKNNESI